MNRTAIDWFARFTTVAEDWTIERILATPRRDSVAVVIPARNEESTITSIVSSISRGLVEPGVIDELIVIDSLSSDATAARARQAGADVYSVADISPELGVRPGKGEALWKSQFVTDAEILVFLDADLTEWGLHFVTGLLGPMLTRDEVLLVKGYYDRVLESESDVSLEGGRVTELVARPWLALHRPELSAVVQPLGGEWAIRRSLFESLSIPCGYGVEIATLLDTHSAHGLDAIAQVDLGRRAHKHQHLHNLTAMAVELLAVADRRRIDMPPVATTNSVKVPRYTRHQGWHESRVPTDERPPTRSNGSISRISRHPGASGDSPTSCA